MYFVLSILSHLNPYNSLLKLIYHGQHFVDMETEVQVDFVT